MKFIDKENFLYLFKVWVLGGILVWIVEKEGYLGRDNVISKGMIVGEYMVGFLEFILGRN